MPSPIEAVSTLNDGVDVLSYSDESSREQPDVLLIAVGAFAAPAVEVAQRLAANNVNVTVVDPRWIVPVPSSIIALADDHDLVVVYEDGIMRGGLGSLVDEALSAAEVDTPLRRLAFPNYFPKHQSRDELLVEAGLDVEGATSSIQGWLASLAVDETD